MVDYRIDKLKLANMYKLGDSTLTLSKKFNLSPSTIIYYLKKENVKLRSKKEALKIGFKLGRVRIKKHKISNYSRKLSPEKSYLIGVLCGDGYVDFSESRGTFQIGLQVTDKDFSQRFSNFIRKVYKIEPYKSLIFPRKKNWSLKYEIRLCSKEACLDIFNYGSFKTKNWRICKEIRNSSRKCKSLFLQGFFDSEGDIDVPTRRINLTSINPLGLQEIQQLLIEFNIKSSLVVFKVQGNRSAKFVLRIQDRKSIKEFYENIGFGIGRKNREVQKLVDLYN